MSFRSDIKLIAKRVLSVKFRYPYISLRVVLNLKTPAEDMAEYVVNY